MRGAAAVVERGLHLEEILDGPRYVETPIQAADISAFATKRACPGTRLVRGIRRHRPDPRRDSSPSLVEGNRHHGRRRGDRDRFPRRRFVPITSSMPRSVTFPCPVAELVARGCPPEIALEIVR